MMGQIFISDRRSHDQSMTASLCNVRTHSVRDSASLNDQSGSVQMPQVLKFCHTVGGVCTGLTACSALAAVDRLGAWETVSTCSDGWGCHACSTQAITHWRTHCWQHWLPQHRPCSVGSLTLVLKLRCTCCGTAPAIMHAWRVTAHPAGYYVLCPPECGGPGAEHGTGVRQAVLALLAGLIWPGSAVQDPVLL